MERAAARRGHVDGLGAAGGASDPSYVEAVLDEVRRAGRCGPATCRDPGRAGSRDPWWGWDDGKGALEFLFWAGDCRRAALANFERAYDLHRAGAARRRCWPRRRRPKPRPARELLALAARALGVGTASDLATTSGSTSRRRRPALAELVEDGRLVPVEVEGWAPAGLPRPGRRAARGGSTPARCCRRSTRWCGSATGPSGSSASATASRSTRRRRSGVYGYYVLPFLLGRRARRPRRPEVRPPGVDAARAGGVAASRACPTTTSPTSCSTSCASWRTGSAWSGSSSVERGDLAATLGRISTGGHRL